VHWNVDILGEPFESAEIPLPPDRFGACRAVLVRGPKPENFRGSVLYVHGFNDYFFQTWLAESLAEDGWWFHAVDLRRYGRSVREGDKISLVNSLADYDIELRAALSIMPKPHVYLGHSTGGLTLSLFATREPPAAMVLNAPFLDLPERARKLGRWTAALAPIAPDWKLPLPPAPAYGRSLHVPTGEHPEYYGRFSFNQVWKDPEAGPIHPAWMRAVRKGHAQVSKGLGLDMPILVMHSNHDGTHKGVSNAHRDVVLDVADQIRLSPRLGKDVTRITLRNAVHDVFLSSEEVIDQALAHTKAFLNEHLA